MPYIPKIKNVEDPFLIIGLLVWAKNQKTHLTNSTSLAKKQNAKMGELNLWLLDSRSATAGSSILQNQAAASAPAAAALAAA